MTTEPPKEVWIDDLGLKELSSQPVKSISTIVANFKESAPWQVTQYILASRVELMVKLAVLEERYNWTNAHNYSSTPQDLMYLENDIQKLKEQLQ